MPIYTDNRTGNLFIEFQYKGVRYKERLTPGTTKKDAEKLEVKIKNDLMFQSHGISRSVATFESFIRDTFGPIADGFPKQRYDRVVLLVKAALPFLKGKAMRSIKAADIERVKASRAALLTMHDTVRKPATIEREMCEISNIFSIAVRNDVIESNPCTKVKKITFDNVQDKILRREHEEKFFAHLPTQWSKDVCRFALYTGLRQNDIMNLTKFQVDLQNKTVTLIQGKTKRRVVIALNSIALEILERRLKHKTERIFPSPATGRNDGSVRHSMQRACVKAKIPVITIRDLRRTNATRKLENGADAVTVAQSLGHTGLQMMPRYIRSLELMQKAADSLVESAIPLKIADLDNVKFLKRKG